MFSQWVLENTTFVYIIPALVFLGVGVFWFVTVWVKSAAVSRILGLIPVWSVYAAFGVLLFTGGLHRILHLRLEGVEMTSEQGGQAREFTVGGWGENGEEPTLFVRDYPADALKMKVEDGAVTLRPGSGYERRLLVVSDDQLIPLEGKVPALIPLQEGDEIVVEPQAGGGEVVRKTLGNLFSDFTPRRDGAVRWIGGSGSGVELAAGYPPQVVGIRQIAGDRLELRRGAGLLAGTRVFVNGLDTGLHGRETIEIPYRPAQTILELRKLDPLAGKMVYTKENLRWQGEARAVGLKMTSDRVWTMGGDAFDDIYVKGLSAGALRLTLGSTGLRVENAKEIEGLEAEKTLAAGRAWAIGVKSELPWGGTLGVRTLQLIPNTVESEVSEKEGQRSELYEAEISWQPNSKTTLDLPRRLTTLPVVGSEMELWTYLPWQDRVYPLANSRSVESGIRSCIVHGAMDMAKSETCLLVMEPGVKVLRDGKEVKSVKTGKPGVLKDGSKVEFMALSTLVQPGPEGVIRTGLQPREVVEPRRVLTRKTLASLSLLKNKKGQVEGIRALLDEPEIEAVDLAAISHDNRNSEELADRVAFGVNDHSDWAGLPHQVRFQAVTDWFDRASGEVELNGSQIIMHDDYRRETKEQGEVFTMGGKDRLVLRAQKRTVPVKALLWLAAAALICTVTAPWWASTFAGSSFFFALAFLTGSRILFRQAVAVNYPFDEEAIPITLAAAVVLPIALLLVLRFGGPIVSFFGRLVSRVFLRRGIRPVIDYLTKGYTVYILAAVVLLLIRVAFLMAGMKEAIPLAGSRFALSILFVPAFLLLFAAGVTKGLAAFSTKDLKNTWSFLLFCGCLLACQLISGLLVSDLGTFLYAIPPALTLFVTGLYYLKCAFKNEKGAIMDSAIFGCVFLAGFVLFKASSLLGAGSLWLAVTLGVVALSLLVLTIWLVVRAAKAGRLAVPGALAGALLLLPLIGIVTVLAFPKAVVHAISPGLESQLLVEGEIVTDSTLLRVLHFADEEFLVNLGTDASERILQDHAIIENYARRGMRGEGYLQVDVIPLKKDTALNDNVSAVYIFGQFGAFGAGAICLAYLGILLSNLGAGANMGDWVARLMAMSLAFTSIYMLAANWGLTPFTGRNMYLLGLDSNGDMLESAVLLGFLVLGRSFGSGKNSENGLMGALSSK